MTPVRISNTYLNAILALLVKLGGKNVSRAIVIEAWRASGHQCDDVFFLHFDALLEYRFLSVCDLAESEAKSLICKPPVLDTMFVNATDSDQQVSITHEGSEFLHCFGGR